MNWSVYVKHFLLISLFFLRTGSAIYSKLHAANPSGSNSELKFIEMVITCLQICFSIYYLIIISVYIIKIKIQYFFFNQPGKVFNIQLENLNSVIQQFFSWSAHQLVLSWQWLLYYLISNLLEVFWILLIGMRTYFLAFPDLAIQGYNTFHTIMVAVLYAPRSSLYNQICNFLNLEGKY